MIGSHRLAKELDRLFAPYDADCDPGHIGHMEPDANGMLAIGWYGDETGDPVMWVHPDDVDIAIPIACNAEIGVSIEDLMIDMHLAGVRLRHASPR